MSPLVSRAAKEGLLNPLSIHQLECYEAGVTFARTEGIIPAPETTHAIAATIREAKKAKEEGKEKVIVFNFSGHGLMDLVGYDKYFSGELSDYDLPDEVIKENLKAMEHYPKP
jgi:tryptophan synthase beta chain